MVNAFITEHFIVVSGDQRRVHIEDNEVFYDDAPKLFTINDRVLIGLTGDYDISLKLMAYLNKRDLKAVSPHEVARTCQRWLKRRTKPDTQQTILIAGIDDKKAPSIIEITHRNGYKSEVITVEPGRIEWRLVYANTDPQPIIEEELAKLDEISPEACAELARKVNERVAAEDSFVSATCDVGVLSI